MDKSMRRNFMVEQDVVPSDQPWWRVTGGEWPATMPSAEVEVALSATRYAREAQRAVWQQVLARINGAIFDHVEVWETDGKVVMVTSHVSAGAEKIEAAQAWATANGVDFSHGDGSKSWHDGECTLFVFSRKE